MHGKASTPRQLEALVRYLPTADTNTYLALGGKAALDWAQSSLDQHVPTPMLSERGIQVLGLPYGGPNGGRDNEGQFFSPNTDFLDGFNDNPPVMYLHGSQNGFEPEPVGTVKGRWYDRKGGWFNVEIDPQSPRYAQLMDAHATGNLRASSGAVPASVTYDADGHIDTWLVGELSLVDIRDGYRPVNAYAITKAMAEVHFEDYYGEPVEEKPMSFMQRVKEHIDALMLLLAREEMQEGDDKCRPDMNEEQALDLSYIAKSEEVPMADIIPSDQSVEKCEPCEEAARLADELKAELSTVAAPVKCSRCPEAVGWIRSMVKAGKMSAVEAFSHLDVFTESDATFDGLKAEVEGRTIAPAKAQVFIAGGQASNTEDSVDAEHMNKQRRLAGLPVK